MAVVATGGLKSGADPGRVGWGGGGGGGGQGSI